MKRARFAMGILLALAATAATTARAQSARLGVGAHYWRTIDDVSGERSLDDSGIAWVFSYQGDLLPLLKLEADLEVFPDGFGFAEAGKQNDTTYAPQALVVVGGAVYGGLGIGMNYADGEFAKDPFYLVRAGLDLELLPNIHLDLNANYLFIDWEDINAIDQNANTDTITLGAAVRIGF